MPHKINKSSKEILTGALSLVPAIIVDDALRLGGALPEDNHLVSTMWFKPSVFQTDKENQTCAGGAHLKMNSFNCSC